MAMLSCPYCKRPWKSSAATRGRLRHGPIKFQCRGCGSWYVVEPSDMPIPVNFREKKKVVDKYKGDKDGRI